MSVALNVFSSNVSKADFRIVSPQGTVVWLSDHNCKEIPVGFGRRTYADESATDNSSPPPVGTAGIPASYTFADGGQDLGGGTTDTTGACYRRWDLNPDWPSVSPYWGRMGAWAELPPSVTYAPSRGTLADFDGESATGNWLLQITEYRLGAPDSWQAPTQIQSLMLTFQNPNVDPDEAAIAKSMIQNFMATRASRLLSEELNLKERLTNPTQGRRGQNSFAVTQDTAVVEYSLSLLDGLGDRDMERRYDIWAQGSYHRASNPSGDVDDYIGHFGIDYWLNSRLVFGVLATVDHAEQNGAALVPGDITPSVEGTGWLAGPYVVARPMKGLIFDGRVQWGTSHNTIQMMSGVLPYEGDFNTKRFLVKADITGEIERGPWLLEPSVGLAYTEDKTSGPISLTSGPWTPINVDGVKVTEGRLNFGHKISHPIERNGFTFIPSIAVSGVWQFDRPDYVSGDGQLTGVKSPDTFMRIEGSFRIFNSNGMNFGAKASYEGLGAGDNEAFSSSLDVNVAF